MSTSKYKRFIYEKASLKNLLFEQEDVFDTAEDEGGEEEAADEGGEEEAEADEGGEEGGADAAEGEASDEGADDTEEEKEDEVVVDPADEIKLSKSVDQDLEALLMDYEMQARKSKEIETQSEESTITIESLSLKFLTEQDTEPPEYESNLDLDRFTAEVARLVKNYTSLLDMEKMLVNKAREFLLTRYGDEAEAMMLDILSQKHDIEVTDITEPLNSDLDTPTAVGAGTGGAGGAA